MWVHLFISPLMSVSQSELGSCTKAWVHFRRKQNGGRPEQRRHKWPKTANKGIMQNLVLLFSFAFVLCVCVFLVLHHCLQRLAVCGVCVLCGPCKALFKSAFGWKKELCVWGCWKFQIYPLFILLFNDLCKNVHYLKLKTTLSEIHKLYILLDLGGFCFVFIVDNIFPWYGEWIVRI